MYFTISPYLGDLPDPQQQRGPGPPGLHRHPLLQAHQDTQLWNGERETHDSYAALGVILKKMIHFQLEATFIYFYAQNQAFALNFRQNRFFG